MKREGDVSNIDSLGRIVIPVRLRRKFDLKKGDALAIFTDDESIIFQKYIPACVFCDSEDDLVELNKKSVCKSCIAKLSNE